MYQPLAGRHDLADHFDGGAGGVLGSAWGLLEKRGRAGPGGEELPEDMSTVSLVGGGLIAGDSLAALVLGIVGLLALVR